MVICVVYSMRHISVWYADRSLCRSLFMLYYYMDIYYFYKYRIIQIMCCTLKSKHIAIL